MGVVIQLAICRPWRREARWKNQNHNVCRRIHFPVSIEGELNCSGMHVLWRFLLALLGAETKRILGRLTGRRGIPSGKYFARNFIQWLAECCGIGCMFTVLLDTRDHIPVVPWPSFSSVP